MSALELITFAFVLPHVRESRKNFACRIRKPGFEIWNTAQGIRIQGPLTQTRTSTWNPESRTVLDSLTWGDLMLIACRQVPHQS